IAQSLNDDPAVVNKRMDEVDTALADTDRIWAAYQAGEQTGEEKRLAGKAHESYKKFVAEGLHPVIAALRAPNTQLAMEIMQGPMRQYYSDVEQGIQALAKIQLDVAKAEFTHSQ